MNSEPENLTLAHEKTPASRTDKGVGSGAGVGPRASKRKAGEPCRCPVCGYYTRIYGACYVCLSVTGRRKKESTTERQPRPNTKSSRGTAQP